MTKDEVIKLLTIIKATYPQSFRGMNEADATATITVWADEFMNVKAKYVYMAAKKYHEDATKVFAPTINDMRRILDELKREAESLLFSDRVFGQMDIPDMCKNCEGLKPTELQFLKPCRDVICPKDDGGWLIGKREKYALTDEKRAALKELVDDLDDERETSNVLELICATANDVKRLQ